MAQHVLSGAIRVLIVSGAHYSLHMIPTPESGPVRSADELNERIRDLMLRSGGRLSAEQRREYEVLVAEWAAAERGGIVKAA
ncbi:MULTISPECIES: hypothetical protein [unclassified Streptomyces]|uniref:hypothetical protein n=1 Tax=unclassified Streptomyces TaxID=2593676 RepID=UPI002E1749C0|nr:MULTISPECIES: hypothetical protein [unclassified Streptomyces]